MRVPCDRCEAPTMPLRDRVPSGEFISPCLRLAVPMAYCRPRARDRQTGAFDNRRRRVHSRAMTRSRLLRELALCGVVAGVVAAQAPATAQTFPAKSVRIVSPYPAGISPDVAARVVAEQLSKTWGQQVLIDPRPG